MAQSIKSLTLVKTNEPIFGKAFFRYKAQAINNMTTITNLIEQTQCSPQSIEFTHVIAVISENYDYTPIEFKNTETTNALGENEGSCKIFFFAKLHGLDQQQTLALFGHYYRDDVLNNPNGTDHANIRQFIQYGWQGIVFSGSALVLCN